MDDPLTRQISVRIPAAADDWLQRRAGDGGHKADVVRHLIEEAMEAEREAELRGAFERAAAEVDAEERAERELVTGAFVGAGADGASESNT